MSEIVFNKFIFPALDKIREIHMEKGTAFLLSNVRKNKTVLKNVVLPEAFGDVVTGVASYALYALYGKLVASASTKHNKTNKACF